jgi:ribosomal protein S18 acetylase RimI-like enzyme
LELRTIQTEDELSVAFSILVELRPHLTHESFRRLYQVAQQADSYTLVGVFEGVTCIAVMGYRVLHDFVHGRHLYIDDLVVTAERRSQGIGEKLLSFAQDRAKQLECVSLRLCTGTQNVTAMRFYDRCGWAQRAVVYKKQI